MQEVHGALLGLRQKFESGILYGAKLVVPEKKTTRALKLGIIAFLVVFGIGGWFILLKRAQRVPPKAPEVVQARLPRRFPAVTGGDKPSPLAEAPKPIPAPRTDGVLTNQSVLELAAAKVPDAVIIGHIRSSKTKFDLSTTGIIELTKGGVAAAVIDAMRHPAGDAVAAGAPGAAGTAAAPAVPAASAGTRLAPLLGGVPFEITLMEEVPMDPAPGMPLHFQASKDVEAGGAVVIAKGAAVSGEVLEPGKKNILGRGGKPAFKLMEVTAVDGSKVKVKSAPGRSPGKNERNLEPPGHRGKDSLAPAGSTYLAYFDGDQTVAVKK